MVSKIIETIFMNLEIQNGKKGSLNVYGPI